MMIHRTASFVLLLSCFFGVATALLFKNNRTRNERLVAQHVQQQQPQQQQTQTQQGRRRHYHRHQRTLQQENATHPVSSLWWESEDFYGHYTHFPPEMSEFLSNESRIMERGSADFFVYSMVPEPPQRLWPLIKGITIRNHLENKILWIRPGYLIADGLEMKCRQVKPESNSTVSATGAVGANDHQPVESALCFDHCTHMGRYCAPVLPANLPSQISGKELVKEALRRLCMDQYYHASDFKFFRYLENFERANCLYAADMTACSLDVIDKISHLVYDNFASCVGDDEIDSDVTNDRLEQQLKYLKQYNYGEEDMPALFIGGNRYQGEMTTRGIFDAYCASFQREDNLHPLSCDICGPCSDVRTCLWTLVCDGVPFDAQAFMTSQQEAAIAAAFTDPPSPTESPTVAPPVVQTLPQEDGSSTTNTNGVGDNSNLSDLQKWEEKRNNNQQTANNKVVLICFIVALSVSALTAALFVFRDRRARSRQRVIAASMHREDDFSSYRDGNDMGQYHDAVDFVEDISQRPYTDTVNSNNINAVEMSPRRRSPAGGQPPLVAFLPDVA